MLQPSEAKNNLKIGGKHQGKQEEGRSRPQEQGTRGVAPFAQSALTAIVPLFLGYDHGHWLAPSQHQAVMSPPGPPSQDTTDQAAHQTCFASWSRRQEVPDPGVGRAGSPEASLLRGLMAISPDDRTRFPSVHVSFLISLSIRTPVMLNQGLSA